MKKEDCIAYIIQTLWRDYGVNLCPEEQPIFIMKMFTALEGVEKDAKREVREAMRLQTWLN